MYSGIEQEQVAHCQELLEANHAERARHAECKHNKIKGIDRPAKMDDKERLDNFVCFLFYDVSIYLIYLSLLLRQ